MYETSDIRKGLKITMDGYPWEVVDFQFVKPGKGTAFTRVRLKNLKTGQALDRTFKTGERMEECDLEEHTGQYMYSDGENYFFMNQESFEQISIPAEDAAKLGVIVAHQIDGKAIPVRERGPLFVIYPFDSASELRSTRYYERSIWQLKSMRIE